MLRPQVQHSLRNAREYFREHLRVGDYYMEGRKIDGEWFGRGAEILGLAGKVDEKAFLALCDGNDPRTGRLLTLRLNSTRCENGRRMPNRRIFYDFTIGPPKSVSIVALCQDERIVELHNRAVRLAMAELEKFSETRVRMSGQDSERPTGNLVGASFRHDTSRELDPHLHTHCVVLNATFDPVERRWKALQTQGMYRAQKFVENYYFHELCKGLRTLGYEIENNARNFEIRHVPADVIVRFSKRRRQIEEEALRRIGRDGFRGPIEAIREQVAHDQRRRKIKDSTAERLRPSWISQMSAGERAALARLAQSAPSPSGRADIASIVAWADQHLFERRSVVEDHELMSAALARGRGHSFDLADLTRAVEAGGYIREAGTRKLTSRAVLRCELDIVLAAAEGRRRHAPLAPNYAPRPDLTGEQAVAVRQILGSRDFMTLFRGGAGTGKSYALKEVERGLAAAGRPVVVLAPQRQQVRDLAADGLPAQTLAQALAAKRLPSASVVILDEAGQVGGRELRELIRLVQAHKGRLILSGDTRQHGAVSASDALVAIERYAGLKPAEIWRIRRQDPALGRSLAEKRFIRDYRTAVKAAAAGRNEESFDRLDRLGCVRELAPEDRRLALAAEYVAAVARKDRALVVAQTWDEVRAVNETIREQLREKGWIGAGFGPQRQPAARLERGAEARPALLPAGMHRPFSEALWPLRERRILRHPWRERARSPSHEGQSPLHAQLPLRRPDRRRRPGRHGNCPRRPAAAEVQWEVEGGLRRRQWRTCHGAPGRSGRLPVRRGRHRHAEDPGAASAPVHPGLCGHILRLAGQDGGDGAVRRFLQPGGDERQSMVCRHFAGAKAGHHLHFGQGGASREYPARHRPRPGAHIDPR